MEVDLDRELMNSFKTMNTTDRDVLINEFLRVSTWHIFSLNLSVFVNLMYYIAKSSAT